MYRCIVASLVLMLSAFAALSGPNQDASVLVDHDANTAAIEAAAAGTAGDEIVMAIKVESAVDLDGFAVELTYDPAALEYVDASTQTPDAGNFLASAGGTMGPFLKKGGNGEASLAGSIVGKDRDKAPDGNGVIAFVVFKKLVDDNAVVSVHSALLIDPDLVTDAVK